VCSFMAGTAMAQCAAGAGRSRDSGRDARGTNVSPHGLLHRRVNSIQRSFHLPQVLGGGMQAVRLFISRQVGSNHVQAIRRLVGERIQRVLPSFLLEAPIARAVFPHLPPPECEHGNQDEDEWREEHLHPGLGIVRVNRRQAAGDIHRKQKAQNW
jgi:hypothetical protein